MFREGMSRPTPDEVNRAARAKLSPDARILARQVDIGKTTQAELRRAEEGRTTEIARIEGEARQLAKQFDDLVTKNMPDAVSGEGGIFGGIYTEAQRLLGEIMRKARELDRPVTDFVRQPVLDYLGSLLANHNAVRRQRGEPELPEQVQIEA